MPTAAKLISALAFAALGWFLADLYVPGLEGAPNVGRVREICAAIGAICGWKVMGNLVGQGMGLAAGSGLRTSVTMAFFCFLGFSTYEMVLESTKMVYDGPMEALLGIFEIMVEYLKVALTPAFLGTLVVGGVLAGMLGEWTHRQATRSQ
jgi:hypothetical protein